tara:strand:+ start:776 stop:1882 length:1107 start_codon:yes stop_codon:yes gene_type:complete
MNVLIDATTLLSPKGGIGHYTQKIASALQNNEKFDVNFFFSDSFSKTIENISYKRKNIFKRILNKDVRIKYILSNYHINKFIKKNKIELFHQPNFITYDLPIKNISSVHDLSWIHFPNFFSKNDLKTFDLYFEKSLENSTKIIVGCNFIKKELCNYFNIPATKVEVTYHDVRGDYNSLPEKNCLEFLNKFKLSYKNFFLIINTLDNRKNFDFILDVYDKLNSNIKNKYPLVIFGQRVHHSESIIKKIDKIKNCFYFDYLDENLKNQCFSSAKIFFHPSLYEGFGISPLESMASGTPVIASDIESSKEILGDNVILLDLNDELKWISKIGELLENQYLYKKIVTKALNHTLNFKKGSLINQTLDIYKRI